MQKEEEERKHALKAKNAFAFSLKGDSIHLGFRVAGRALVLFMDWLI